MARMVSTGSAGSEQRRLRWREALRDHFPVNQSSGMLPVMSGTKILHAGTIVFVAAGLLFLCECDDLPKQAGNEKAQTKQPSLSTPTHRFVQYSHNNDIAFDTQTGQLCRTWDWAPVAPERKPTPEGMVPERSTGELTPTCLSLFKQYPTTGNAGVGIIEDSSAN